MKYAHMVPLCNVLAVHVLRKQAHKNGNGPPAGRICLRGNKHMFSIKELRHFGL